MKTKQLAIYKPKGAANEYSVWACNLFNGCPHNCDYCYCKRGVFGSTLGKTIPTIKKQLGGTTVKALLVFKKELDAYRDEIIRDGGLFFSFTTDPMVQAELPLTFLCMKECVKQNVPVIILTKAVSWFYNSKTFMDFLMEYKHLVAVGFTLTGHDELEGCAPLNDARIAVMGKLHDMGVHTWASIEPVVSVDASIDMINKVYDCCELFKVGLRSGVAKDYYSDADIYKLNAFLSLCANCGKKIYPKDSLVKRIGVDRSQLNGNFVPSNYNLF